MEDRAQGVGNATGPATERLVANERMPEVARKGPYPVRIEFCLNGFVVKVGCQTVVYTARESLLKDLDAYLAAPDITTKNFLANALNARLV